MLPSRGERNTAPALLRTLLARLLPRRERGEILLEMDQLYEVRLARIGRLRAGLWYLRRSFGFPLRLVRERTSELAPALASDLRQAVRSLRHDPGFTLLAAGVLALAVGGATAFFSIVDHAVLRPLPYPEPESLVTLQEYRLERGVPEPGQPGGGISYPNLTEIRQQVGALVDIGAIASGSSLLLGADQPLRVRTGALEPSTFEVLGLAPTLGRPLQAGDRDRVVLSQGLWRERFGGTGDVIGRTVTLDGREHEIVGVMPSEFLADLPFRLWVPFDPDTYKFRDHRGLKILTAIGRLAAGTAAEQARAAARTVGARLAAEDPDANKGYDIAVLPLHDEVVGARASVLWRLLGASVLLLAIACLNVANLQLARFTRRRRDAAVRAALGAGRGRILRLAAAETLLVGLLGATAGLLLATMAVRGFVALDPTGNPRLAGAHVDLRSLVFAIVAACGTSILAGVIPLSRLRLSRLLETLQLGSPSTSEGLRGRRLRDGLLVGQIGVTAILLGGAALVSASFLRLWTYELGFDPDDVLTFGLTLNRDTYPESGDQYDFYRRLFERLEAIPEVASVGATSRRPLSQLDIFHELHAENDLDKAVEVRERPVSGSYFEVMRVPMLAGQTFRTGNGDQVILNAAAARRLWPEAPPDAAVGRRVRFASPVDAQGRPVFAEVPPWHEVVGVVGDVRYQGLEPEPVPAVYRPLWRQLRLGTGASFGIAHIVLRTRAQPDDLAATIREAVWELDPAEPVQELLTMNDVVAESMARPRFYALLFSGFAIVALTLCFAGVFGVTGYLVAARGREIGIRVALGAPPWAIARLVLLHGLGLAVAGAAIGMLSGLGLTRHIEGFLHGTSATDPRGFLVAMGVLALAIVAGMAVPCLRALRVDPVRVLRQE